MKTWLRASSGQQASSSYRNALRELGGLDRPRVVVIGGATIGHGSARVLEDPDIETISFDLHATAETSFVADGHRIPLVDGCADGVWVQAVLEHVYQPAAVVAEIRRILRPGGLVYAETPFLQPVHEGPYDFTRYSEVGHRLLFAGFEELSHDVIGGPGATLALAVRGLVGGLTRSSKAARLAYAVASPSAIVDRWCSKRWRVDFATAVIFVGRRTEDEQEFDPTWSYRGAQR